jgi:hypothetical protein
MTTATEIQDNLPYYYGSEERHKFSILYPKVLLTDGAKYIADSCQAYWLFDVIASYLSKVKDVFYVAKLVVNGKTATFTLDDGNKNILVTQNIEFTDFPLEGISLYVMLDGTNWTICLPSEY